MKITKKPFTLGTLQFSCSNCGTEWELLEGEYIPERGYDLELVSRNFFTSHYDEIPGWVVRTSCPSCDCMVRRDFPTGEPRRRHVPSTDGL